MTPLSLRLACGLAALFTCISPALAQPTSPSPATPSVQPPPQPGSSIVSPEVGADRRVTFRILAPEARKLSVAGQWDNNVPHDMTKDADGVWSITLGPIEPSFWIYNFVVDGVSIADPVNPLVKLRMRTSASLVNVPANPPALWEARNDVAHGAIEINWHNSAVTHDARPYYVYTPPGYDPTSSTRYPVLYLLHGNNGTPADWTAAGHANFMADNLIAAKRVKPMIIVMPWGHAVPFGGPQAENDATFDRYLIEEVMPAVEKKYRVASGAENRAIMGLSMGGRHAVKTGLTHLNLFGSVGAYSAAPMPDFETQFKDLLADATGTNAKLRFLWIGCGRQDALFATNEKLDATLTANKIRHTFLAIDGFHDYYFWRRCFIETAPLLFR
jgi:enterochelin esterase-like enzyme